MPRIEEYLVHWEAPAFRGAFLFALGVCGQREGGVHLVVGDEEFLRRAAGVCRKCAEHDHWKSREKELLGKTL